MRFYASVCALVFLIVLQLFTACEKMQKQVPANEILRTDIEWLAHEERQGRLAGTLQEADASNYISDRYLKAGLEPHGDNGTYIQQFVLMGPVTQALGIENTISRNVVGIVRGHSYPERVVVVGAHYDGQGTGGVISMNLSGEELLHPSADDNASGTAGLLYLAKEFADNPASVSVLFVAFSGEEPGLLGSEHFVTEYDQLNSVFAMINLDMIGRMDENELILFGTSTSSVWPEILSRVQVDSLEITQPENIPDNSDHAHFYNAQIPVLHYHTGTHNDYHRESDTAGKLNYTGLVRILNHVEKVIRQLSNVDLRNIDFNGEAKERRPFFDRDGAALGVLPDYNYTGEGFRIEKVLEGDIAENSGLQEGDIIIEMAGKPVLDIYDYMEVLNEIKPGQSVHILIIRNEASEAMTIQF